jgi:simple sugar transport system permease protein
MSQQSNSYPSEDTDSPLMKIHQDFFSKIIKLKEISIAVITLTTILFFYTLQPLFLSSTNVSTLLSITPELGIPALGITILMIAGEFDLSIGSVFGFTPLLAAEMINSGIATELAITLALLSSSLIGLTHGIITVKSGIPSFITTLGGMLIWRGAALLITGGQPRYFGVSGPVADLVVGPIFPPISAQLFLFFFIMTMLWVMLDRTRFGNHIYATGGSRDVARYMGVNTDYIKILCFILSSLLAGFGGIIQSIRLGVALPNQGDGLEFDAIAAAVIGGTSLRGGSGTVVGTAIGEFLSRIIENGLVIIGAPSYYFRLYIGVVLIVAVVLNLYIARRAKSLERP